MTPTEEFLRHVLPAKGPFFVVANRGTFWHFPEQTIEGATRRALLLDAEGHEVFFAVGAVINDKKKWDGEHHKYDRTAANIRGLRSYILDIDAGRRTPDKEPAYNSVEDATRDLIKLVNAKHLPRPTIVHSGGGLHVYWTLTEEVEPTTWKRYGEKLAAIVSTMLVADHHRTSDAASVLRVVGTHNRKWNANVRTLHLGQPTTPSAFHALLDALDTTPTLPGNVIDLGVGSNTGRPQTPLPPGDPRKLITVCRLFAHAVNEPKETSEECWHGAISLCLACGERGEELAHAISKGDERRYEPAKLDKKIARHQRLGYGPISCTEWQKELQPHEIVLCHGCEHNGKITSPLVLAHANPIALPPPVVVQQAAQEPVEIVVPPLPADYIRTAAGIGLRYQNTKTGTEEVNIFCPVDMFPLRMQYDERTRLGEGVRWMVKLPREDWSEIEIPHVGKQQLQVTLHKRGIYIKGTAIELMEGFMTAYLNQLQRDIPREIAFSKMGWRPDGFLVGDTLYKRDGTAELHSLTPEVMHATQNGMMCSGDYDEWLRACSLYSRVNMEPWRMMIYSSLASMLYTFTGQVATVVNATGETGRGKTTVMRLCASMWGHWPSLMAAGSKDGSTRAALEAVCDAMNNLPVFFDEIGSRDAKDIADMIFNYSGGKGKIRGKASGGMRADVATWSNIMLCAANADEYGRMSGVYRDVAAHMVRLIQIEFPSHSAISKAEGDYITQTTLENYGFAGYVFAEYVAKNDKMVAKMVRQYVKEADQALQSKSEERFWTAWIGACRAAAEIAYHLGMLPGFPISSDIQWMYKQVGRQRVRLTTTVAAADEILSQYLDEQYGGHTLHLQAQGAGNISNIQKEPHLGCNVRYEADNDRIYMSRSAFQQYCNKNAINMTRTINDLLARGIVIQDSLRRVLGAGTIYATGYIRCIEIDASKLGGMVNMIAPSLPASGATVIRL